LSVWLVFEEVPALPLAGGRAKLVRVEATGNVFDAGRLMELLQMPYGKIIPPQDAETFVKQGLDWRWRQNLYAVRGPFLVQSALGNFEPKTAAADLAGWKQFWGSAEADSLEGRVRYQGGDVLTKLRVAPETVIPEDFRLRPDSAGYRAGEDGKDLGADIDLVGPGKAYERWKQTPEYQQWLKDTGQIKDEG